MIVGAAVSTGQHVGCDSRPFCSNERMYDGTGFEILNLVQLESLFLFLLAKDSVPIRTTVTGWRHQALRSAHLMWLPPARWVIPGPVVFAGSALLFVSASASSSCQRVSQLETGLGLSALVSRRFYTLEPTRLSG